MLKLSKSSIPHTSLRLNLLVVSEMVLLLLLSLAVLFYFSRQTLKEEAKHDAEQTLEGTVQHIDNILMSVEQTAYNVYQDVELHLDQPDRMFTYCREVVECNPYIGGCAIAMKPGYYPDRETFMAYVHKNKGDSLVTSRSFGTLPYTEQVWYTIPMESGKASWTDPLKEEEDEGVTLSFCLPIFNKDHACVGIMAIDLPTVLLSKIVLAVKPFPNSYSILLSRGGLYIVHPDKEKLSKHMTVFTHLDENADPRLLETAESMTAGETGHHSFRMNGEDYYMFYKPFQRSEEYGIPMEALGWSAGLVCLEDDIFGDFNHLTYLVLIITVVGMLLFFVLCRWMVRRQMKTTFLNYMTTQILEVILLAAPVFIISLGFFYLRSRNLIRQEAIERSKSILSTTIQRINNYMGTIEASTNANAWLLEEQFTPDALKTISQRIVGLNPLILSCSVSADPNTFPQYGTYFSIYTTHQEDTIVSVAETEFDYSDKVWYKEPINKGKACWVDPFSDYTEGVVNPREAVATYCRPLRSDDGRLLGVVSTDMSFSQLARTIISTEHPYPNAYFMLLGGDGRYLIHPDTTCLFRKTIFTDADPHKNADRIALGHQMIGKKQGTMHFMENGKRCHVCYQPVPGTDWSLAMVCPDSEILEGYHRLAYVITALILIGLLIMIWLCHHVVRSR